MFKVGTKVRLNDTFHIIKHRGKHGIVKKIYVSEETDEVVGYEITIGQIEYLTFPGELGGAMSNYPSKEI